MYDMHCFEVQTELLDSYYRVAVVAVGQIPTTDQWEPTSLHGLQVGKETWRRIYD